MKRLKMAPRIGALLGLALLLVGAVVAPATAHRGGEKHARNGFHHHDQDGKFFLRLTGGDTEPPPGGDPDARGVAKVVIDPDAATVCVRIKWADIDGVVTNSHIHVAPPGPGRPDRGPTLRGRAVRGSAQPVRSLRGGRQWSR